MRISIRVVLCLAAAIAFAAAPVYAQHGGGGGGASGHISSSSSTHGNSADAKADKSSTSNGSSVSEKLADNTNLSKKLLSFFPTGTTLQQLQLAAQGYKNLGQFVAAVHVSNNLHIPFDQLKAQMMGPPKESLGKAIHALKPAANATEETKKGEKQAKQDMDDSKTS